MRVGRNARLVATAVCLACARPPLATDAVTQSGAAGTSVTVEALSKGQGVPPETKAALQKARDVFRQFADEGRAEVMPDQIIGLEGERRLCASFKDRDTTREALDRLHAIARGVPLLNVKEEPCPKPQPQQQREEKP